jgi:polysaccharide export outer membrane protein
LAAVLLALSAGSALAAAPLQGSAPPPASAPGSHAAQDTSTYRIGAGDVLEISVWNEPQASVQGVVVRPDGKISLPLIKEVPVIGLTPLELQQVLTTKLEKLIRGADITVVVREIHSKKIYLVGAVGKVGPMPLTSDDTTVLQALAEAGGLTPYAKKKKIYVLRKENGKQVKLPFDYDAVVKGEHMEQNITLLPDDTIMVP